MNTYLPVHPIGISSAFLQDALLDQSTAYNTALLTDQNSAKKVPRIQLNAQSEH